MIVNLHDRDNLKILIRYLANQREIHPKFSVGLTSGCYDLFHYYHLMYLEKCRRQCDFLIVGIDSDSFVRLTKGDGRPVFPEIHRASLLDAIVHVDVTFIMDRVEDFATMAEQMKPNLVFKSDAFDPKDIIGLEHGAKLRIIPDVEELTSTTGFIERIIKMKTKGTES